jgi:hypothetical protein
MRRFVFIILTALVVVSTTPSALAAGSKALSLTTIDATDAPVRLASIRGTAKRRSVSNLTFEVKNISARPIYSARYLVTVEVTGLEAPVGIFATWGDPRFGLETVAPAADQPAIAPGASARLAVPGAKLQGLKAYLDYYPTAEIRSVTVQPDLVGFGDGEGWVTSLYFDRKTIEPPPDQSAADAETVAHACTKTYLYWPFVAQACECMDPSHYTYPLLAPTTPNRSVNRSCLIPGSGGNPPTACTFQVIVPC